MSPDPALRHAADRLARCRAWIRAWTPTVVARWWHRHPICALTALAAAVMVGASATVHADSGTGAGNGGNVLISWMGITDSHGVPVAKYTLTLNEGGWNQPGAAAFAYLDSFVYEVYVGLVATALWLIKTVLNFGWLQLFAAPFHTIGSGVGTAMERYGLAPTAIALLAIIAAFTVLAGRTATAVSHIAMGLLMVGVAATIFAHPLAQMIGPDGLLAKGRQTGMEIAATVSGGKDISTPDQLVGSLADRFLRSPTQMINFGMVSDSISRKCEQAWTDGINNGRGDKLKDDMKGCDGKKGEQMHAKTMDSPAGILASLVMVSLLGGMLIGFSCFFVWHVIRTAVHALLYAALAPPAFAIGVIPGGPRLFAWKTVLDCLMAYAAMIIYVAAFGAYNAILDRVFTSTSNAIEAIFLTALILAFGFAFFGPLRRMFDRQRDSLAARISGGAGGSAGRGGGRSSAAQLSKLHRGYQQRKTRAATTNSAASASVAAAAAAEAAAAVAEALGGRGAARVDAEAAAGAPAAADGDGQTPSSAATVDSGAGDTSPGGAAAGGGPAPSSPPPGGGGAGSVRGGGEAARPAPARPVTYLAGDSAAAAHDRLAAAQQMQRGASRPAGAAAGGVRHSMSESA